MTTAAASEIPLRAGPLAAMTVVDISQQLPGPYASMLLRELGARVIKVEPPQGDLAHRLDPQMFALINQGKDIVRLDLKSRPDVAALHRLVADADVFIEGFRPGVTSRLGADWNTLANINPRLVYCSISAAGQEGPYAKTPMHDLNLQGFAGLEEGRDIGVPWVDLGTATTAALAIVSHWHDAQMNGCGSYLDSAMLDTAVLWARVKGSAHGRVEPTYGIFRTYEGRPVAVAILEDHIWVRLCEAFAWDDWRSDTSLSTYAERLAAATQIQRRLAEACAARTFGDLTELARRYDLPLTPTGTDLGPDALAQLALRELSAASDTGLQPDRQRPVPLPIRQAEGEPSPGKRS